MDRFRRLSGRDRRLAGSAAVVAVVVVIVAGVLAIPRNTETPLPSSPSSSAEASATGAPSPSLAVGPSISPTSSPSVNDAWSAYSEPAFQPTVSLTADAQDAAGVSPTSTFTLHTQAPVDAAGLARSIDVTPTAPFDIVPGADARSATIRPVGGLKAGQAYRFALHDTKGAELGSWAFAVKQPLHVASTLPDNQSTDVPLSTGIEITFDQDGATDVASHVTIEPALTGTTETHGRTFVFVPSALTERTLYTVTVHRGIAIAGSDQVLARDVRFSFETGELDTTTPAAALDAERYVLEASPSERLVVAVTVDVPDGAKNVTSLPVRVYRLGTEARALAALRLITDSPNWARYTQIGQIDVAPLTRVASFTAPLTTFGDDTEGRWFRMPMTLPTGWYVMDIVRPDRHLQMFLQVTDIATYTAVTTDHTVVWVNDTSTHAASPGARVSMDGGRPLGRTDARGLLIAATPGGLVDDLTGVSGKPKTPILIVRAATGRSAFFALSNVGTNDTHYLAAPYGGGASPSDRFLSLLYTDRYLFRQTDTVHVWGLIRDRDRLPLPGAVQVRLMNEAGGDAAPPILTRPATLTRTGTFALNLPIEGLPIGRYLIELYVGPIQVSVREISVDVIRKPAYQIAVSTDKHAVVGGDPVLVSSHVTFYDGTAVPQTQITIDGTDAGDNRPTGTTDQNGNAVVKVVVRGAEEGYDVAYLSVMPVGPEEGTISGNSNVLVFPSSLWLNGTATIAGSRLTLAAAVHDVDFAGLERHAQEIATGVSAYGLDPRGKARSGVAVDAVISELVPVRTFDGRKYDFITKQVVDTYTYSIDVRRIATHHLVSGVDGSLSLSLNVAHPQHGYRITLTARDGKSRQAQLSVDAEAPLPVSTIPDTRPFLSDVATAGSASGSLTQGQLQQASCGGNPATITYAVGDRINATMSDGRGALPSGGTNQYLFLTAQRGLRDTRVQSSPRYSATFTNADVPNLSVLGVRFTGTSYAPVEQQYSAVFDPSARALSVHLSTDAVSYRPGGLVTLTIQTRDASGRPVAATVTLRAIDEKLYTIGGAAEIDPLPDLYQSTLDGIVRATASREDLYPVSEDGCGATGGGGDDGRADFRDSLMFRTVTTDAQGRAVVSFHMSDDLTSWHISAAAVTSSLQAGEGQILVPVGLPFFVETGLAPEYLLGDRPSVRVRAFGSALKAGDAVTFTVSSATLPMAARTVQGTAFQPVDIPLPALALGDQTLTVSATTGSGRTARTDKLTRHFSVITSRLATTRTSVVDLAAGASPQHGDGPTTYLFSDAGRGRFLPTLEAAAGSDGARLDQALARSVALDLEARFFALPSGAPGTFEASRYQNGGLSLLPYSGADLELSADVALVASSHVDRDALSNYFVEIGSDPETTRERAIIALAGRAGLGEAVLPDVRAAAQATDLTPTEELYLGLAAAALGDDATALRLESALLSAYGQRQGPWVRLAVDPRVVDGPVHATALLAVLAAKVGDPVADAAMAYVTSHPATETVTSLLEMGYVEAGIRRSPAAAARFAYTVDGVRRVVDVPPGEAVEIVLTAGQAASLQLEPISGQVAIATSWRAPATLAATPVDPVVTIKREQSPAGDVPTSGLVTVTLTLTFKGTLATDECYDVTDLAPSGLAPTARLQDWPQTDDNGNPVLPDVVDPYAIEGQQVRFCAAPLKGSHTATLRYYLRVVTAGTYIWEPAVAQSSLAPAGAARTEPTTIVVR